MKQGKNENQYERLKSRLLRYKVVAYVLLLFIIITNIETLIKLWHSIFPYKAIIISCESKEYYINEFEKLALKLNVLMSSEKQVIITDASIDVTFHLFDEESGSYEKIETPKITEYFVINKTKIPVPPLDNTHNKHEIVLQIRFQVAGKYMAVIRVISPRERLTSEEKIYITVPSLNLDFLSEIKGQTSPIFIVKDDILDVSPNFLFDIDEFKAILLYEAEKTNIVKSTIWIHPTYIGAAGGSCLRILRNPATVRELQRETIKYNYYIEEVIKSTTENRHMEELCILSVVGSEIVPIGGSFYCLSILDSQRIQFRKLSLDKSKSRILLKKDWGWIIGFNEWEELKIPDYGIKFKFKHDCGAVGRICVFELHIGGKEYSYFMYSPGEVSIDDIETDFPIFINKSSSGNIKYLRIDIESDLIISEHILDLTTN